MVGLTNAGTLLSGTTSSLAILLGISQSTAGLSILSVATTVPEKFVAYKSARKAQAGVLVANTVGSDVFLLTLVLGVVWAARGYMPFTRGNRYGIPKGPGGGDGDGEGDGSGGEETLWMWVDLGVVLFSSVWLWVVVRAGTFKRRTGVAMIVCYIAYLVFLFAR
jgi:Ca2+/Na+ antiporter